ncbi:MAG: citramalate synthase [Thermoproteota archaeon]
MEHNDNNKIIFFDTTLRDGNQAMGINFTLDDKIKIALKLDELGVNYIEGGWPNETNLTDLFFFQSIVKYGLRARVSTFGRTRKVGLRAEDDPDLKYLAPPGIPTSTIFGKSWLLHVKDVLKTTPEENLSMVYDTIKYLKELGKEVIFDAEHFFDGYKDDADYAIEVLRTAEKAGASFLVLADTRGASDPLEVYDITRRVREALKTPLGIHAHNDTGMAVANSVAAVKAGAVMVHGTVNGIGERCGNTDLIQVIGVLASKLSFKMNVNLRMLSEVSRYVRDIASLEEDPRQPFVGKYAFSHKAGVHVDALLKNRVAYEFADPELFGNNRAIVVSSQAGTSNLAAKAQELGFSLTKDDPRLHGVLKRIKELEARGYVFEGADGNLFLLLYQSLFGEPRLFELEYWTSIVTWLGDRQIVECVVKANVGGVSITASSEGNGPVNAFDNALKKALSPSYPQISYVSLTGFRVKELDAQSGTAASVRIVAEFQYDNNRWTTVGVSTNILKAAEEALVNGYKYFLLRFQASGKI